jgi:hypothetical protein
LLSVNLVHEHSHPHVSGERVVVHSHEHSGRHHD